MRLVVVCTVGASLLLNYARYANVRVKKFLEDIESLSADKFDEWVGMVYNEFLVSDPENVWKRSAELSSLRKILEKEVDEDIREVELVFLISNTKQGEFVCKVYERFFREYMTSYSGRRIKFRYDVIEGLTYEDLEHARRGLPILVSKLSTIIRNFMLPDNRVILNVTGGFKAECICAAVVGMLMNVPVYYLHEMFEDAIRIPLPSPAELSEYTKEDVDVLVHMIRNYYENIVRESKSL